MRNKKILATLSVLRKILDVFSSVFLNIYLFKLVQGDFNFILSYAAFNAIAGFLVNLIIIRIINSSNANRIFRFSFICEIVAMLVLLVMQGDIIKVIWPFALLQRIARVGYYTVYEVTLIRSAKNYSISSFVAGINIISSLITMVTPIVMGYIITAFSWHLVFILLLIDAVFSMLIASKADFRVVHNNFRPKEYWRKISKNKTMRKAYLVLFLRRLSSTDGVLEYLLPVLLFLALGTEFSVGNYDSLFSVVYIIMLEGLRILNRKGAAKRFYVPLALLTLISASIMVADFSTFSILLFYFTIKTGGTLIVTEGSSMIYAIGNKEKLSAYTREHQMTWNIFLVLGNLVGIAIAYIIYNNFYSKEIFAVVILVLMIFFVLQAYILQKVEEKLGNG